MNDKETLCQIESLLEDLECLVMDCGFIRIEIIEDWQNYLLWLRHAISDMDGIVRMLKHIERGIE